MSNKKNKSKITRRKLSPKAAAVKRTLRSRRPLHKKVLLHPITAFGLLCFGVFLVGITWHGLALSYTVTGVIPAPALTDPAIITYPTAGSVETSTPITVVGTCPADSYVTLDRNGLFSGVDICSNGGFSIETDLFVGLDQLQAQDYNLTDQAGPTSPVVDITYTPTTPVITSPTTTKSTTQSNTSTTSPSCVLLLDAAFKYQIFKVGQTFQWTVNISGCWPPYSANVSWGDGSSSIIDVGNNQSFVISHIYFMTGKPIIKITGSDSRGNSAFLQLTTTVMSQSALNGVIGTTITPTSNPFTGIQEWLWLVWPVYATIVLMAVSFWLGEYQEYVKILRRQRLARHN
jgi:hypothetical protein